MIHVSVPNVGRQNQNISTPGIWQSRHKKRQNEEQIEPLTNNQIKKIKAVYQTKTAE